MTFPPQTLSRTYIFYGSTLYDAFIFHINAMNSNENSQKLSLNSQKSLEINKTKIDQPSGFTGDLNYSLQPWCSAALRLPSPWQIHYIYNCFFHKKLKNKWKN